MKVIAPFTDAQVEALNRWQDDHGKHPFTCARDHDGGAVVLAVTRDGWYCPALGCDYEQDWAHDFMVNPS